MKALRTVLNNVLNDALASSGLSTYGSNILTYSEPDILAVSLKTLNYSKMFEMKPTRDGKKIEWVVNDYGSASMKSLSSKSILVEQKNYCKTKHDLIVEYFSGSIDSDSKWSTIDPDSKEHGTPDFISKISESTWLILEVGTCIGTGGPAMASYRLKHNKYLPTIERLAAKYPHQRFIYWIVIVGPNEILSTFKMNSRITEELSTRYFVGVAMESAMKSAGLLTEHDIESETVTERLVRQSIRNLSLQPMNGVEQTINDRTYNTLMAQQPDHEYLSKSMEFMVNEAKKLRKTREDCIRDMNAAFIKLEAEIEKPGHTRDDRKAPVQIPLILAETTTTTRNMNHVHVTSSSVLDPVIDKVWRYAYNYSLAHPENFESEDMGVRYTRAALNLNKEHDMIKRSKWHRVEVQLDSHEEMHLSRDGYHAKKYKDQEFYALRRSMQQRSFSLRSPTDDIAECLEIVPSPTTQPNPYFKKLIPLIRKAEELSGNTNLCASTVEAHFNTDIATALCIISAIGQELSISLKQHVDKRTWIFKKLLDFEVEMLVSPTNSESHIFYLLRYKGTPLNRGAFRDVIYYNGWWYTELLSINSSRLDNLIKAPCTYINTLLHFKITTCRMSRDDLVQTSPDSYAERVAMLTTLMALEDKAQTEDMALNVRYMVMQFVKGDDELSWPDLGPIVLKNPTIMRSRLAVYIYKQIKLYCVLQWEMLPVRITVNMQDPDHSPDQFKGLLCPFTHQELTTFYDAVQMMYIAYSKNKNSTPEQNCDFAMIEKIAAYVLNTLPEKDKVYRGEEDPTPGEFPGPHEFSYSFIKQSCQLLKLRFRAQLGESWRENTGRQIVKELIKATHHEAVATMKASADFDQAASRMFERLERLEEDGYHKLNSTQVNAANILLELHRTTGYTQLTEAQWEEYQSIVATANLAKRGVNAKGRFGRVVKSCKCHEAVVRELSKDPEVQPLLIGDYTSIFKSVMEETRGICCYLFKKQQHGGLREIYVLTFRSRLLQLLPEVCSRVICSQCPEEVLTHPHKKTHGYEQHNINVMKVGGTMHSDLVLHRTSSEDKSKWSQKMNVTEFALTFMELLPEDMAKACIRVMHAFRNKRVLLPEGVVSMFMKNVELENKTYQKLKTIFWSKDRSLLFDTVKGQVFLKTPTGMWQGILHYSSSNLHVLQSVHYKNMAKLMFQNIDKAISAADGIGIGTLVLDTVVSSDDSATYGTVILPAGFNSTTVKQADDALDLVMKLSSTHSRFFMMEESPKSCISSRHVGEFNSIFVCSKTYISPAVKKVLASVSIPESEDIESRQVTLANMHKDILEEGCSFHQVQLHSICNSIMHYSAFGLFINPLFENWVEDLVLNPDPHLGFWLMDVEEISGLLGYNFIKYNSLKGTSVAVMPNNSALVRTPLEGDFNTGVVVTQGDRKRWEQFKSRVIWPGWEEYIENNPETLYMEKGMTREEIQSRLSAKACSKGVHESLKVGTSDSRTLAASVYVLDHPVVTVRSLAANDVGVMKEIVPSYQKQTLISLTRKSREDMSLKHSEMEPSLQDIMYPNNKFFEVCKELVQTSRNSILVPTVRHRRVRAKVEVRIGTNSMTLPIMTVLRWKWLSSEQRHAVYTLEESWKFYKGVFSWLKDTLEETLTASPFQTHIAMHTFICSIEKKSSRVSLLCKRINSDNPIEQITELIRYNYFPELMRVNSPEEPEMQPDPGTATRHALHRLSLASGIITMAIHAPVDGDVTELIQDMTGSIEISDEELVQLSLSQKYARQASIFAVATGRSTSVVERILLNSGKGIIKQYIVPQKLTKNGWKGPGRLLLHTRSTSVEVLVMDHTVAAIKCASLEGLMKDYNVIAENLSDDGFTFVLDISVRALAKDHFKDVTDQSLTEWLATRRGLVRTALPRPTVNRRGMITMQKKVASLDVFNPVVIVNPQIAVAIISEGLSLRRGVRNECPYIEVVGEVARTSRLAPLLRFYGPKRPQPLKALSNCPDRDIDTESILDSWMVNEPIDSVPGLKLLKAVADGVSLSDDFSHIVIGTDETLLPDFVKRSFKWRVMSQYKLKISNLHYSSDLPPADNNPPILTRAMQEDMNKMMDNILDDYVPQTVEDEEPFPAAPELVEPFNWADAVEEEMPLMPGQASTDESDKHDVDVRNEAITEQELSDETGRSEIIEAPLIDLQQSPGLYMVHNLWNKVIDNLESRGVWDAMNKGFKLSKRNQNMVETISKLLSIPIIPNDYDDETEGDSD